MRVDLVELVCQTCGTAFAVRPKRAAIARFCSVRCSAAARTRPLLERLMEKLNKDGPVPDHVPGLGPCWVWTGGSLNLKGYASMNSGGRGSGNKLAHRISWEVHNGTIPAGLNVLHKCDRPACCRPDHLFLGTLAENNADMTAKGRHWMLAKPELAPRGDRHWTHQKPQRVARGEDVANAVVDEAVVRSIRAMAEGGVKQCFIAAKLDLSRSLVSRVITRRTWAHVV